MADCIERNCYSDADYIIAYLLDGSTEINIELYCSKHQISIVASLVTDGVQFGSRSFPKEDVD